MIEPGLDLGRVIGGKLETEVTAVELLGDDKRRPAAAEGVEDDVAGVGTRFDDPTKKLFGHLAAVPAGRSLKVPQTRGKYQVSLSAENPSGTSCGRKIQVSSGTRPAGLARLSK